LGGNLNSLSDDVPQTTRLLAGEQLSREGTDPGRLMASNESQGPTASLQTGGLADQFFAWLKSLKAGDYAAWTIASISIGLGAYAVKSSRRPSFVSKVAIAQIPRRTGHVRVRPPEHSVGVHIG